MRTNLLVLQPPRTIEIDGLRVPIRTGYRRGIQCARIMDDGLEGRRLVGAINQLYFPDPPSSAIKSFEAAIAFYTEGSMQGIPAASVKPPKPHSARVLDWDEDAAMILADFRREYGIDLSSPDTQMHWFAFMAYFNALSDSSEIKVAMYYRGATKPSGLKGEESKRWEAQKRRYRLPPRSREDAMRRECELWGD